MGVKLNSWIDFQFTYNLKIDKILVVFYYDEDQTLKYFWKFSNEKKEALLPVWNSIFYAVSLQKTK